VTDRLGHSQEGPGDAVLNAFVEIVFDNSDHRLLTHLDQDEASPFLFKPVPGVVACDDDDRGCTGLATLAC
jgi:hypothetical protein